MPELIRDIKAKVNDIEFPLPISEESKDLIRRLLKPNPKERIDWLEFFNHPLFQKFDNVGQTNNLNDLYSQIGELMVDNEASNIENEFHKNQKDE